MPDCSTTPGSVWHTSIVSTRTHFPIRRSGGGGGGSTSSAVIVRRAGYGHRAAHASAHFNPCVGGAPGAGARGVRIINQTVVLLPNHINSTKRQRLHRNVIIIQSIFNIVVRYIMQSSPPPIRGAYSLWAQLGETVHTHRTVIAGRLRQRPEMPGLCPQRPRDSAGGRHNPIAAI